MWILISFPGFDNKDEGKIYQQFSKIQNSNLSEINPLLNFIATETDKSVVHKWSRYVSNTKKLPVFITTYQFADYIK